MSKVLFLGAAALGGVAFFSLITRYSLLHSMTGGGMSGGDGTAGGRVPPPPAARGKATSSRAKRR